MEKINFQRFKKYLPGLKQNISLAQYTTFKVGGPAQYFFTAKTKEDLIKAVEAAQKFKAPFFILAGGSNLLVSDKGFNGLVIKIQNTKYKTQNTKIIAGAGAPLPLLLNQSVKNNLTGLEWAVGIPGTVGGAIRGNTGAFGVSMGDIVKKVEVLDIQKKLKIFKNKDCKFKYRDSIFKHKKQLIILETEIQFEKGDKKEIQKIIKKYLNQRRENQPLNFPSAGSVFKNFTSHCFFLKSSEVIKKFPELAKFKKTGIIPAGYLIDKCGLKGKKIGKAQISEKHANFIVNLGGARAKDIIKLMDLTKLKIKNEFGIILKEEIQYLGF